MNQMSPTNKKLRILVVAPSLDILGGQAVQAARLIERLKDVRWIEIGFLPINPRAGKLLGRLQRIKYARTVVTSLLYILSLFRHVWRFDVLHVFSASYFSFVLAPTPAILIGKLFGKKVLLNYHSGEAEDHFNRWPSAVKTLRLADALIVPSNYLVRVFSKFNLQASAIKNLVDLESLSCNRVKAQPCFLSNRNFESHYRVDDVLRAFALIQRKLPDARLIVAGDGSQRHALHELSRELNLRNVEFVGAIDPGAIADFYAQGSVFLNASEVDNQPLSILEAFAAGVPVVTTDAGGIPDMVSDGVTGFIVRRHDYAALASQAIKVATDNVLADRIAKNASAECRKYTWDAVGNEWLNTYLKLRSSSRFQKFRQMSIAEMWERGMQAFASFCEQRGWSNVIGERTDDEFFKELSTPDTSAEEVVTAFKQRSGTAFFKSFQDRSATVAEFRSRWPKAEVQIIAEADRILSNRFDLLGFKNLSFGDPINWHLEPLSGKTAPRVHWSKVNYLDAQTVGDKKITWELNRHQYFVKLGQAYWLTGDEKYAEKFAADIASWMDQNPPKLGINWASSLEVAFRSISWLWALHFFSDSPALTPTLYIRCLKFLRVSGQHIERYLSTYFSPNTHLTGEALGLFYLGSLLPELKDAPRWRALGRKILIDQAAHQVRTDGVYFEQASYYHRYTADFLTHFVILSNVHGEDLPTATEQTLQRLLDHLMYITRPDGTTPLFGDEDGGRLLFLDRRNGNDFRGVLSTGAVLFERGDYKFVSGELAEESFWLLGLHAAQAFDRLTAAAPEELCKDFADGGIYVMRDSWSCDANYLLFDCGPHGADNCGHAHADAFAIEVAAHGKPALVDAGTFTYTGSKDLRDWFRSSQAHNVLTIDGQSSSLSAGPFSWATEAQSEPLEWIDERRFTFVAARHNGYERLTSAATHTRSILFLKNDYWILHDHVRSEGAHNLQLHFHFLPQTSITAEGSEISSDRGLKLFSAGLSGSWSTEKRPFSECYGHSEHAPVCTFAGHSEGNAALLTLLLPGTANRTINEIEAIGGCAIEVCDSQYRDVVLVRDDAHPIAETVTFRSDFKWMWARFERNGLEASDTLLQLIVIDGIELSINGNETIKSSSSIKYAVATRVGERFRLETKEGAIELALPVPDLRDLFSKSQLIEV